MTQQTHELHTVQLASLLTCYGFDLKGLPVLFLLHQWLEQFSPQWIHWAVVEALYQGRYKAISVEHLLNFWEQRGEPHFHFNQEFERLISQTLPRNLPEISTLASTLLAPPLDQVSSSKTIMPSSPEKKSRVHSIEQFQPVLMESRLLKTLQTAIH